MHRTKKLSVFTTAAALLMGAAGMSSAMAHHRADHDNYKVTICHATGQANPPYNRIHVSKNAEEAHDHHQHDEDVLLGRDDSNTKQCPTTPVPPGQNHKATICHLLPDGSYDRIHVTENSDEHNAHKAHPSDIIARDNDDDDDCPTPDDEDENCSTSSSSGNSTTNQGGLVNIAALNGNRGSFLPNLLCGPDIVKNVNVLGGATGDDAAAAGDDCNDESTSGDSTTNQGGLLNIAALNGNRGSFLPNLLCGPEVVKNVNVLGVGLGSPSLGGSSLGSGVLNGGPAGLLSGADYLLYGLDVNVLAKVLVIF